MRRGGLLVLSLYLLAVACAGGETTPQAQPSAVASTPAASPATPRPEPVGSPTTAPVDVPENLAFTANLVGGGQLEGGDLAGRDVVLWFWAPW